MTFRSIWEDFDLAAIMDKIADYMDDDIREDVHGVMAPCTDEEFLKEYLRRDPSFEIVLDQVFGIIVE